ncbi:hypothetical protein KKG71_00495 [Patescibacteria group bacterium]|nr:hypothetical protein [Patescibacteria group bacterium]
MRSILSISLPPNKKKDIEGRAKKANMTLSAYIMYTVELEKQLIGEDELVKRAKRAELDYKNGKTKELRSLADLMNE